MTSLERRLELPQDLASVTRARHFVRDVLRGWGLDGLVEDAQLGTSELVANAVRHAGTDLLLTVRVDAAVTIAIRDGQPELRRPVIADAGYLAENGRGLHIVAAISSDWGITTAINGKIVWFDLALPETAGRDADVLAFGHRNVDRREEEPEEADTEPQRIEASQAGDERMDPAS